MSLTRNEWLKMWQSVITIEKLITESGFPRRITNSKGEIILYEVDEIKAQIQSVVGQLTPFDGPKE